jgi:hypothetical protein
VGLVSSADVHGLYSNKKSKNLCLKLLESINYKVNNSHTYNASLIKRVWVLKTFSKLRPLGIPATEDKRL